MKKHYDQPDMEIVTLFTEPTTDEEQVEGSMSNIPRGT